MRRTTETRTLVTLLAEILTEDEPRRRARLRARLGARLARLASFRRPGDGAP